MKYGYLVATVLVLFSFTLGVYTGFNKPYPFSALIQAIKKLEVFVNYIFLERSSDKLRAISTSGNKNALDAYVYTSDLKKPLIVSLHAWSSDWKQDSLIAPLVINEQWNYIHPNFQGKNNNPNACLSLKVIEDIDKAIDWMITNSNVDTDNIFVIGASGGGYTALGYRAKTKKRIKATFAWVPITDLVAWYYQSKYRGNKYHKDILGCVGGTFDLEAIEKISPINYPDNDNGSVTLYAGINDGYLSSVPTSHSIIYFNKFAKPKDRISQENIIDVIVKGPKESIATRYDYDIFLDRKSDLIRIVIFDGGHELKPKQAFRDIMDHYQMHPKATRTPLTSGD